MVKKFFSAIAAFALLFASCEALTGDEAAAGKIRITSEATINAGDQGNCYCVEYVIEEAVEGAQVTATPSAEWIHLNENNPITETQIFFCIDDNTGEARTGTLEVKYAGCKATITINQAAGEAPVATGKISITSEATINAGAQGNCYSVDYVIEEAVEGAQVTATPSAEWIHLNENNPITETQIFFCIDDNTGEARTGTLEVKYAGAEATITINQAAAEVSAE